VNIGFTPVEVEVVLSFEFYKTYVSFPGGARSSLANKKNL
jgi:hypothetical protein